LLESIELARQQYYAGGDQVEIVVADNALTGGMAGLARADGRNAGRVENRAVAL